MHKVLINCTKKSIKLTTPDGKEFRVRRRADTDCYGSCQSCEGESIGC
jgi:hypothetical protein